MSTSDVIHVPRLELAVTLDGPLTGGVLTMGVPTARDFGAVRRGELDETQVLDLMSRYVYASNLDTDVADLDFVTASSILSHWFDAILEAAVPKTQAAA